MRADILNIFKDSGHGLKFTYELPEKGELQFLDIRLRFHEEHLCWRYKPRSVKGILPFTSGHSKIVKSGIIYAALRAALLKTCTHALKESFLSQVERLKLAGYPDTEILRSCQKLIKWVKGVSDTHRRTERVRNEKKPVVVPYLHKFSHCLKNAASRYGVRVVMSAPNKLSSICSRVHKSSSGLRKTCSFCPEKRKNRYVQCKSCVVYKLPLSCGGVYIGQTGRCINVRLREHLTSLTAAGGLHLPAHCRECGCQPMADKATCLFGHRDKCTREVMEAFFIEREGERCVSKPSVALGEKEVRYLGSALPC